MRRSGSCCSTPGVEQLRTHLFDKKPPVNLAEFMDPARVAAHIVRAVAEQQVPYLEQEIARDSPLGQSLQ